MGFLKRFGDGVRFFGDIKRVAQGIDTIQKSPSSQGVLAGCETVEAAVASLGSNSTLGNAPKANASINDLTVKATLISGTARAFIRKDFDSALALGMEAMESRDKGMSFLGMNRAMDALGQVKIKALRAGDAAGYQQAHGATERQLVAATHRAFTDSAPQGAEPTAVATKDPLHGVAMGAAYLRFLSGDIAEARELIGRSIQRAGAKPIEERELGAPRSQFWFYENLDKPSMDEFRGLLAQTVQNAPAAPIPRASGPKL